MKTKTTINLSQNEIADIGLALQYRISLLEKRIEIAIKAKQSIKPFEINIAEIQALLFKLWKS